jgi:hypothetical protein
MFREELPRVQELRDLIEDPAAPSSYFQGFDNSIRDEPSKKQVWLARETQLCGLDGDSWEFLKTEALPYLTKADPKTRGWQQLVTILNQAFAYNFLKGMGCSNVRLIPRADQKGVESPDLEGELSGVKVLCEVKTLNISDEESIARSDAIGRTITDRLEPGFFSKLISVLKKAKKQIDAYDSGPNLRRIAYVVVNFNDLLGEYKKRYYQQIDDYLAANVIPGIEVVFHNQMTCFHTSISMTHATVVNE